MTIQFTNNNGDATITLCGRLDTSVSTEIKSEIDKNLATAENINSLTMDAEGLEYISSSGLRILLVLAKSYKNFKVVNVNPDVYDVLNMTGFSKIINVERALRQLSIDGCEQIGVGGVGTVYRLDGDTIIKVFREGTTIDEVRKEITMSKEAFVMGTPTAISFDIVKVGSQYGLVYELLNAETLSFCIKRSPERIDEYARLYANLFRQLHSIEVPADSNVPNAIEHERQQILHVSRYFPKESIDLLLQILDTIPTGDNELMLIDMGEMGYGHPVLDLGHAYSSMVLLIGNYDAIVGIPHELGKKFWDLAINYYFEGLPADVIEQRKTQIDVVARIRNFSWLALSDSFPESVIKQCQELFDQRITARRDYILDVCKTFKDWTL